MITNNIVQKIEEYKKKAYGNYEFHTRQARNSNHWHASLDVLGVILTAGLSLTTIILTALKSENLTVSITSGVFAFFISVTQRIQSSYSFITLEAKHYILADNYYEVYLLLENLDPNNIHDYELIMNKYMLISQKHTQNVKECMVFCCFK